MAREAGKVAGAREGERNHTLLCAAIALGQLVGGGVLAEEAVREALLGACAGHFAAGGPDPFTVAEAENAIANGLARGIREPRNPTNSTPTNQLEDSTR